MNKVKCVFFVICSTMICSFATAQTPVVFSDTVKLSQRQKDRLFLKRTGVDQLAKFKKEFTATWDKVFVDFTDNDVFLIGGINFAKQNISANGYRSPFLYEVNQKDVYKPGFMAGFRIDGKFKEKHPYGVAFTLNKYATGVNYKETRTVDPFVGSFSNFKAEEQLFTLNMTALYKKIIPISDTTKYKFSAVAGPSIDFRLSGQGLDNQVNNNYRKIFLRAQIGLEFENNSFYTLFFHYKKGLHSISKSSIRNNLNSFDLGLFIKASDLF